MTTDYVASVANAIFFVNYIDVAGFGDSNVPLVLLKVLSSITHSLTNFVFSIVLASVAKEDLRVRDCRLVLR